MTTGTIIRALPDFVFILCDGGGSDVFARRQEFIDPPATFEAGTRVEFSTYNGPKGICAEQVREIPNDGRHLDHGAIHSSKDEYAFIKPDAGSETIFVHKAECDFGFPAQPGLRVSYVLTADKSGRARAAVCRKQS
jgi:cold shock CspA family protein